MAKRVLEIVLLGLDRNRFPWVGEDREPSEYERQAAAMSSAALIASYSSPEGLFWAKLSAASLLAIAPIIVFGWFSQKQLVQGLTFGAVK